MLSSASASNQPGKASTKRSLFARPTWSKTQDLGSSDLFHRSDQLYVASTADAERKRQGKLARKEKERAQLNRGDERASKRLRMSEGGDEDNEDGGESDDSSEAEEESGSDNKADCVLADKDTNNPATGTVDRPKAPSSPPKSIPVPIDDYQNQITERTVHPEKRCPNLSNVIDLDDDEDPSYAPELSHVKVVELQKSPPPEVEEVIVSDEEFPELARKAREKARKKRLAQEEVASLTPELPSSAEPKTPYTSPPSTLHPPLEPILHILITSSIPNTAPLIVSRKLGQRLKDVRLAWIDRQPLSSQAIDEVFLTWRGKRLFDVTTCRSLGVTVDPDGRVMVKGDVLGDDEGRIHMEAMTLELLEARRRAKTEEATTAENKETEQEMQGPSEGKVDNQIRIILKARGFDEFKLRVKPASAPYSSTIIVGIHHSDLSQTTLISKILNAFRHANEVDCEKDVYIMFEGERLEPNTAIEDAEIADLDSLDTYVK